MAAEFRCLSCTLRSHPVTSNFFPELNYMLIMANWTFLISHARALPCITHDPEVRVRAPRMMSDAIVAADLLGPRGCEGSDPRLDRKPNGFLL